MTPTSPVGGRDTPAPPAFFRPIFHEELVSTNDEARRLADAGAEEGTLVVARRQSGGRGRRGRVWHSPVGNLYTSFVLRPGGPPGEAAMLSFVAAVAVAVALERWLEPARIQLAWPNDVHVDGAKISGILLEASGLGDGAADAVVVGIGVNIRHHPDLADRPTTALRALGVEAASPEVVLADVAAGLLFWYERWRLEGFAPVRHAWLARAMRRGETIAARVGGKVIRGVFADLDESGALVLVTPEGARRRITAGEIHFENA